jgi:hypothetical protein
MSSESNVAFQSARNAIAVPDVPLDAIRRAARSAPEAPTRKRLLAGILGGLVLVGTAAAATETWAKIHFSLLNHGWGFSSENIPMRTGDHPTPSDLKGAAQAADFPVTLPTGLPAGSVPTEMMQMGTSGIVIRYDLPGAYRANNHLMWIILANPKSMSAPGALPRGTWGLQIGGKDPQISEVWQIPGEVVMVVSNTATSDEIGHIKAAMKAAYKKAPH